jgi:anaerobic selenocysteine-containing dehydrogenase
VPPQPGPRTRRSTARCRRSRTRTIPRPASSSCGAPTRPLPAFISSHIFARRNATAPRLIVIDPRTTALAKQADIHLAIRPGTDLPVALSIHRFLFEEGLADRAFLAAHTRNAEQLRAKALPWTFERAAAEAGVSAESLEAVARRYAEATPALIRCGWGQERNRNGGNSSLAILSLPAVAGKFGVRGGGYAMSNTAAWGIERTWIGAQEPSTRVINMNQLGRALTEIEPPVRVLFVYNSNAAVTSPDQQRIIRGLERDDLFTVVFEQVMTDTARYADVVLPATTFLEGYDLVRGYGPISLRLGKPVIEAVGEARPNADVFGELLQRLDLAEPTDPSGELEEMLHVIARMPGSSKDEISEHGAAIPIAGGRPIQFVDVYPRTADRKSICSRRIWTPNRPRACTAISRTRPRWSIPLR